MTRPGSGVLVVADDLTGACDTAVQFGSWGPAVAILEPETAAEFTAFRVMALTTESRNLRPDEARQRVAGVAAGLRKVAADRMVYKKLDSSLRGQLGVEIDALLDGLDRTWALVAPAYPDQARLTAGGFHLIRQVPVGESEISRDPLTPVTESHLGRLIAAQSRNRVGLLPLDVVAAGAVAVRDRLAALLTEGVRVVVADATTPGHLATLAGAVAADGRALPCGAAGLARALAGLFPARSAEPAGGGEAEADGNERPGGSLTICGSQTAVSFVQVDRVREAGLAEVFALEPPTVARLASEAVRRVLGEAATTLRRGHNVVVYVTARNASRDEAAAILAGLGEVGRLLAPVAGRLILTGGDTAMAVCRSLGARALTVEGELLPGIVTGPLVIPGEAANGLPVVTKSGSFGDLETLVKLLG